MDKNEGVFFEIEFEKRFCYNGEWIGKIRTGRLEKQEEKIMKVLLVNGSPKAKGCTYTALQEAAAALEKQGIETEIFQVGAPSPWQAAWAAASVAKTANASAMM